MSYICAKEGRACTLANCNGYCTITACIRRGADEELFCAYKDGKLIYHKPPLDPALIKDEEYECIGVEGTLTMDPVIVHDEISKGFKSIENVIREESAKMAEIIREAIADKNPPVFIPQISTTPATVEWVPETCKNCSNHPSNGGSGVCACTLGLRSVTTTCTTK